MQTLIAIGQEKPFLVATSLVTVLATAYCMWSKSRSSNSSSSSHSIGYSLVRTVLLLTRRKLVLYDLQKFYQRLIDDRKSNNSVPSYWNRRLIHVEDITNSSTIFGSSLPFPFTRIFMGIPHSLLSRKSTTQEKNTSNNTNTTPVAGTLIYIHGGCYTFTSAEFHWDFVTKVITALNYRVIFIQYPLAPESTVTNTLNVTEKIITSILQYYNDKQPVCIMGDSAGGGLSLSICQRFAASSSSSSSVLLPPEQYLRIRSLILISPWIDIQLQNPLLSTTLPHDPMLDIPGLQEAGKLYAGIRTPAYYRYYDKFYQQQKLLQNLPIITTVDEEEEKNTKNGTVTETLVSSPLVNPLYGNYTNLPPNVTLIIGTYDIFIHDCRIFEQKFLEMMMNNTKKKELSSSSSSSASPNTTTASRNTTTVHQKYENMVRTTVQNNYKLRYIEGHEMFHVYPILPFMTEANRITDDIISYIREDCSS